MTLFQVKRIRLWSAVKVGTFTGMALGALGGFLFLPILNFSSLALNDISAWAAIYNLTFIILIFVISTWIAFGGAVVGSVIGAIIMWTLGFAYNLTTRHTGGLLVEIEPRGKLKEKVTSQNYDRKEAKIAPPLALDDEEDAERAEPLRHSTNRL